MAQGVIRTKGVDQLAQHGRRNLDCAVKRAKNREKGACEINVLQPGINRRDEFSLKRQQVAAGGNPMLRTEDNRATGHKNSAENQHREKAHQDRKSTRLNSSHSQISYAVFCLKKKKKKINTTESSLSEVIDSLHSTKYNVLRTYLPWPRQQPAKRTRCSTYRGRNTRVRTRVLT